MLETVRAHCPKNHGGQFLATHYQLAAVKIASENNARGAGRPAWFPPEYVKLDAFPDALPGRYMVRYLAHDGKEWYEVPGGRAEVDLQFGNAAPPAPAAPVVAQAPAPAPVPPQEVTTAAVDALSSVVSSHLGFGHGAINEQRGIIADLQAQLEKANKRNDALQEKIDELILSKLQMSDLVVDKARALVAAAPQPEAPHPAFGLLDRVTDMVKQLAPGINARLAGVGAPGVAGQLAAPLAGGGVPPEIAQYFVQAHGKLVELAQMPDLPPRAAGLVSDLCGLVMNITEGLQGAAPPPSAPPPPPPPSAPPPPAQGAEAAVMTEEPLEVAISELWERMSPEERDATLKRLRNRSARLNGEGERP